MPDPNPIPFARPFAPFFPPSARGPGRDGSFDFLSPADRKPPGGSAPPPTYTPSLDFSDARNSQYVAAIL